jgi:type IV secretion/conjugal transfer VirB4 family ATPase
MFAQTKYAKQINKERSLAAFIPYSSHVSPNIIVTKEGNYLCIWKVGGISHESADPDTMQLRLDQLNTLLRSIGSEHIAVWTHNVRRQISDRLQATFENDFSRDFDKKYYDSFSGYKMMANELYFTVIYRPNPTRLGRSLSKTSRRSVAEIKEDQKKAIHKLNEIAYQVEAGLRVYGLETLSTYEDEHGVLCSKALEFLNFLISGEWQKVRVPRVSLDQYLGTTWLFIGTETIEMRTVDKVRYAQALDFKDYLSHTEPGLLNCLMYEDYEYVMTQSYSFFSKNGGKKYLERQQRQLQNAEDGSVTQIEEMSIAIDELIQGEFTMGEYHFSLMVFGDSVEKVRRNTASAKAILQDLGFLASMVFTATDAVFYAQLPCNWFYRPRIAGLTSKNFAALSSFHNFSTGKRDGNPWGQAVTIFKTPSGQPIYFNYHFSKDDEDNYDHKLLGNTDVIGQSGAGKTVLLGMLLCQSQKFAYKAPSGYANVFFDKDRGAEILIRAIGGKYLALENGKPTGFNPFQIDPTEENILFLEKLVMKLVSGDNQRVTTSDELRISHAVRTVMRMPAELRRLTTVTQNMTEGTDKEDRENSVVKRLSKWCQGGSLEWVLDNPTDLLNFTTHSTYGFDGTAFLDNDTVRTPISMYLLHRMESIIDGRRFIYFMDEFWKWLLDDAFSDFAFNKQKTIRKQNGLGVFATQSPSDVLKSNISRSIIEQCATEIYLPNPKADFNEYVEGFKVTEAEFKVIKNLGEDSRMFLIKQGHHSAIAQLDLSGFDDELAVLSGSVDNVELLDSIVAEVGEDPKIWLPIFHERRKARRAASKVGNDPRVLTSTDVIPWTT